MKIVILATKGEKANMLYHRLAEQEEIQKVIIEDSVSRKLLVKRRIKKLGIQKVVGQILFHFLVVKKLQRQSENRIELIEAENHMNKRDIPEALVDRVVSINDDSTIERIKELNPDLVIVNGTRIISRKVLQAVSAPFINMHAGITPLYRGVHGGYWALVNQDPMHCGVTVHYIDEGIDTGSVIYQDLIQITSQDNFMTYPYLQFAKGLQLIEQTIADFKGTGIQTKKVLLPSQFRTHPTLFEYCYYKKKYGVK